MLHTLSMSQALALWSELEDAYAGRSSYGGDTAEIYAYRLKSHDPALAMAGPKAIDSPIIGDRVRADARNAERALVDLIRVFQERRPCDVEIDGLEPEKWLAGDGHFLHRCHVKITKRTPSDHVPQG